MIEKYHDRYRYMGCPSRGAEKRPVNFVEANSDSVTISYFSIEGQQINRENILNDIITRDEWVEKTSAIAPDELLYIVQRCHFQSGLNYWQKLRRINSENVQLLPLDESIKQSLLNSIELFQFQPQLESITLVSQHIKDASQSLLFSVQLTGYERSGFCGSHSDTGFFIANFSKAPENPNWRYKNGRLIADNHCISSRRYRYTGKTASGFTIDRITDRANNQSPVKDCLLLNYNLSLQSCISDPA